MARRLRLAASVRARSMSAVVNYALDETLPSPHAMSGTERQSCFGYVGPGGTIVVDRDLCEIVGLIHVAVTQQTNRV